MAINKAYSPLSYEKQTNEVKHMISSAKTEHFPSTVLQATTTEDLFSVTNNLLGTNKQQQQTNKQKTKQTNKQTNKQDGQAI